MDEELEDLVAGWLSERETDPLASPSEFAARHPEYPELGTVLAGLVSTEALFQPAPVLPDHLGPWKILSILGSGAHGIVARARDTRDPNAATVALKVLTPTATSDRALTRLRREGEWLSANDVPGSIVRVLDQDLTPPLPYLVLEHVPGRTLRTYLDAASPRPESPWAIPDLPGGGPPLERWVCCIRHLGQALAWAHARGLLHRDIKPANIMVRPDGLPVLLDFGLATDPDVSSLTHTGDVLGTPRYMAPEQAAGQPVGPRTDIFGLGVVLFEGLTGTVPHDGESSGHVLRRVRTRWAPAARKIAPQIPVGLARIVDRMLASNPACRPPSATSVVEDLDRFLSGRPVRAKPIRCWHRWSWQARQRPAWIMGSLVLILGVLVGTRLSIGPKVASPPDDGKRRIASAIVHANGNGDGSLDRVIGELDGSDPAAGFLRALRTGREPAFPLPEPWQRLWDAEALRRHGKPDEALSLLDGTDDGSSLLTWSLRFRIARDLRYPEAVLRDAVVRSTQGEDPVLWAGLGYAWSARGDHSRAAQAFVAAARADPHSDELALQACMARVRAGDDPREPADVALGRGPTLATKFGRFLESVGHRAAARGIYRRLMVDDPALLPPRFHLANSLASEEDVLGAVAEYQEILDRYPRHAPTLVALGYVRAWICGHPKCESVRDANAAWHLAIRAMESDAGKSLPIVSTVTAIARHLGRTSECTRLFQDMIASGRAAGHDIRLLEDGCRELATVR